MSRLAQLFCIRNDLPEPVAAAVHAWRAAAPVPETAGLAQIRFTVLDVETTGLNARRDRLLSIGAVAVEGLKLAPQHAFSAVLRNERPAGRDNIVVHGLTPAEQAAGEPPAQALAEFLARVGRSPCVAFHADFDRIVLERALRAELGVRFSNLWIDLAQLAPALFPEARLPQGALDDWLGYFRIQVYVRHDALHDAYAAAELFLALLARAEARGIATLAELRAAAHAHLRTITGG